jgi:hypothetical protein
MFMLHLPKYRNKALQAKIAPPPFFYYTTDPARQSTVCGKQRENKNEKCAFRVMFATILCGIKNTDANQGLSRARPGRKAEDRRLEQPATGRSGP